MISTDQPQPYQAKDIFFGASFALINCLLILLAMGWGVYQLPPRDMATIGVLFSMMMLWTPITRSHKTTWSGRIACWTICLLSGLFTAAMLAMAMSN